MTGGEPQFQETTNNHHVQWLRPTCAEEKTIFYHKCKVEQYAPYTQDDGLVQRITLYKAGHGMMGGVGAGTGVMFSVRGVHPILGLRR